MTKFFIYAAIVTGLGATATLGLSNGNLKARNNPEVRLAVDGAFRDGLYLGKLTAESGRPARPAIGRWSTDHDRAMFTAGYSRGYSEALAGPSAGRASE